MEIYGVKCSDEAWISLPIDVITTDNSGEILLGTFRVNTMWELAWLIAYTESLSPIIKCHDNLVLRLNNSLERRVFVQPIKPDMSVTVGAAIEKALLENKIVVSLEDVGLEICLPQDHAFIIVEDWHEDSMLEFSYSKAVQHIKDVVIIADAVDSVKLSNTETKIDLKMTFYRSKSPVVLSELRLNFTDVKEELESVISDAIEENSKEMAAFKETVNSAIAKVEDDLEPLMEKFFPDKNDQ